MPIKVKNNLPAKKIMEKENIFMMDEVRAVSQDIRPLQIAILNLMPLKEDTEVQLLRSLSNSPLQMVITFLTTASYIGKNTPVSHLNEFYRTFQQVKHQRFDGLIITGAPVEQMEFEEVQYWEELTEIMQWSKTNVTSTFHICWGAQAGLYYHYGIHNELLDKKVFGIYEFRVHHRKEPLLRGFDDVFLAPHSRYTTIRREDVEQCEKLRILASSEQAGVYMLMTDGGRQVFITGHSEYAFDTLQKEYLRDKAQGVRPVMPEHYFPRDDDTKTPPNTWRAHANLLYQNWLNYYVYQTTPYDISAIEPMR